MLDKSTKKAWTPTTLKVVFSVQHRDCSTLLDFDRCGVVGWTNHSLGVSAVIVFSILFVENSRVTRKPNNEHSGTRRYFKAFVFVGFAIIAVCISWLVRWDSDEQVYKNGSEQSITR